MNKVVITGLGTVTAIGNNVEEFFDNIVKQKDGISLVSLFDMSKYYCKLGGEIKDNEMVGSEDRLEFFVKKAVREALGNAHLSNNDLLEKRTKLFFGTAHGSLGNWEKSFRREGRIPKRFEDSVKNACGVNIPIKIFSTACTSSALALGFGMDAIRRGDIDIAIIVGADELTEFIFGGFTALKALTHTQCKPFDDKRDGLILGEGVGVLILENMSSAMSRKANVYSELAGSCANADAKNFTAPDFVGEGMSICIDEALKDAKESIQSVDYINAHGTGTKHNDRAECFAFKKCFGNKMDTTPISSIKSYIGHTSGACGAIEAVLSALCIKNDFIPATLNLTENERDFKFDFVKGQGRKKNLKVVISTNSGFGGNNSCAVFRKI